MKKLFAIVIAAVALVSSANAVEPFPLVEVRTESSANPLRTDLPSDFAEKVANAYGNALQKELDGRENREGLVAGKRATVVITEFYDPREFMTQAQDEMDLQAVPGGPRFNPSNPRSREIMDRHNNRYMPKKMKVAGYVEFDGRRFFFEETANEYTSTRALAEAVGQKAFRGILSL